MIFYNLLGILWYFWVFYYFGESRFFWGILLFFYLFIYFPKLHINTIYNHNVNLKYKIAGGGAQKDIIIIARTVALIRLDNEQKIVNNACKS